MKALRAVLPLLVLAPLVPSLGRSPAEDDESEIGFDSITEEDLHRHLIELASPELEGRDAPGVNLERAARYIESTVTELGLVGGAANGGFRHTFSQRYVAPIDERCSVEFVRGDDGSPEALRVGTDFVGLGKCEGTADGELVFLGFGITGTRERYDDLKGPSVRGKLALILHGEPRHKRFFEGPDELTEAADVFKKVDDLIEAGVIGVLVVRRALASPTVRANGEALAPPEFGYRYDWARFNDGHQPRHYRRDQSIPVVELTEAAATRLLGEDVVALGAEMDRSGKPERRAPEGLRVSLATAYEERDVPMDNVVAKLRGSDPTLKDEYLVIGGHYDHIGVGTWGRIGCGADDNGTGSSALLELAEAFTLARPKRSILFLWFAAEEDGLVGSRFLCETPPVAPASMVTMLNVDMLGYGDTGYMIAVGTDANPDLEKVLKNAKRLHPTKLKKVETGKGMNLWERSDHYWFHKLGVPALFFTEMHEIDSANPYYHVYTDTVDVQNLTKAERCARFIFNTAWLIANDDERPSPPR